VLYIYLNYLFLIPLQEKIDTATIEGVENVGEEDCINPLAGPVKSPTAWADRPSFSESI
jgi:hypothetical protein